ncbi:HAMP domain-containing histidine kinase [Patescibacteria group bacterium]|nr:HAMP domain-containing histidine kinase [Patescibacteria group bacterium]
MLFDVVHAALYAVVEMVMLRPERCRLSMTIFPITNSPETRMTGLVVRDVTQEREMEQRRNAFISLASHELRTPMTSILGFTELLLDREPPKPLRREWLDRILRDSIRLNAVVDDLLDVSRIQSGKAPVNQEELSLQSLAEEQLSTFVPRTTKHKFVMDFPPDLPSIVGDHQKLGQVLTNLLENAIKYSPNGGQIRISAYLDLDRKRVVTAISDQGIGIAADDQSALFTTFCRIYRPETGNVSGTGLGLYIVKGLVELMNGEVWLDSELGKGSTFFFSTPAAIGVTQEQTVAGIGVLPSRL